MSLVEGKQVYTSLTDEDIAEIQAIGKSMGASTLSSAIRLVIYQGLGRNQALGRYIEDRKNGQDRNTGDGDC